MICSESSDTCTRNHNMANAKVGVAKKINKQKCSYNHMTFIIVRPFKTVYQWLLDAEIETSAARISKMFFLN